MTEPEINIDLSREVARLMICGLCKAITLREHGAAHQEWHERQDPA